MAGNHGNVSHLCFIGLFCVKFFVVDSVMQKGEYVLKHHFPSNMHFTGLISSHKVNGASAASLQPKGNNMATFCFSLKLLTVYISRPRRKEYICNKKR